MLIRVEWMTWVTSGLCRWRWRCSCSSCCCCCNELDISFALFIYYYSVCCCLWTWGIFCTLSDVSHWLQRWKITILHLSTISSDCTWAFVFFTTFYFYALNLAAVVLFIYNIYDPFFKHDASLEIIVSSGKSLMTVAAGEALLGSMWAHHDLTGTKKL